jgi:protein-glutamine gamma-glutamyltransferase
MTFARYFKASSYCLIVSGFAAIASTGRIDLFSVILFSVILAVSWFLDTASLRGRIPAHVLQIISLAYLLFFAVDYRLLSHSLVPAMIHLILFSAAAKLLTVSRDRDYFFLYLISFAELLAASALTVNIAFGICFLLFLVSAVSALALFEMRRSNAILREQATVQPMVIPQKLRGTGWELFFPFPARLMSLMVVGMTLLILVITVPIFFLLPRLVYGLQKHPTGKTQFITGFSDHVELGQIGTIKRSDAVVMRVQLTKPAFELPVGLKWRGLAFDYYDGRSWTRTDLHLSETPTQGRFYKLESSAQGTNMLFQTFFVEPLSTDAVFVAHKALAVSIDIGRLQRDSLDNLHAARAPAAKFRYTAVSDLIQPNPQNMLNWESVPAQSLPQYLQLPRLDPRIPKLAIEATRESAGKYEKARTLERYLQSNYGYSLDPGKTNNTEDPLSAFLFETRKGHCEYFASAMTIMLRSLGVPARLVVGFRSGEYNNIGNNWIVRQHDAHSWVEAFIPPYGWIEFDPTAPDPPRPKPEIIRFLSNVSDALDIWWWEGIVNYDSFKQFQFLGEMRDSADTFLRRASGVFETGMGIIRSGTNLLNPGEFKSISRYKQVIWISAIALIMVLMVRKYRILSLIGFPVRTNPRLAACNFYMDALQLLGKKGMKRALGQTPLEFARSLQWHPAGEHFLALTRMYNAARFGPPGTVLDFPEAESLLRSLRASLRRKSA